MLTVLVFPITTVSLYCNRSVLSPEGVGFVFHKIYYFTLPLGMVCVTFTSEFYAYLIDFFNTVTGTLLVIFGSSQFASPATLDAEDYIRIISLF